ncbi:riboflavin synthase [Micrococcales bacterium 31B]|nr:riboflavin synthase [Micrococcales bacterium 31B]
MFTGLVQELGSVRAIAPAGDGLRLTLAAAVVLRDVRHGDSIAVNGVCLTVVEHSSTQFSVDVMRQTVAVTGVGALSVGSAVNLEAAARFGDRIGGHIVQGHVDATARVLGVTPGDQWTVVRIELPAEQAPLVVDKGSIAVDGVSLTVSAVSPVSPGPAAGGAWFEVCLIPETLRATTLGRVSPGDRVNLETDVLARHLARLQAFAGAGVAA